MRFSFLFLLAIAACATSDKAKEYPYRVLKVELLGAHGLKSEDLTFCSQAGKCIVLETTIFERLRSDEITCRNRLEELEKKLN